MSEYYRCGTCEHFGLCAPDCPIAPWNNEPRIKRVTTPFVYLLRQRRWARFPVDREDTWFMDRDVRRIQQQNFFGYIA